MEDQDRQVQFKTRILTPKADLTIQENWQVHYDETTKQVYLYGLGPEPKEGSIFYWDDDTHCSLNELVSVETLPEVSNYSWRGVVIVRSKARKEALSKLKF